MLLPLWAIGMFFRYRRAGQRWRLALDALGMAGSSLLAAYLIGYFNLGAASLSSYGFNFWSWNLNGFVNPFAFSSAYLKEMPAGTDGQYEGFSYLGLGNLLLLPAAVYLFLAEERSPHKLSFGWPFGAAAVVYLLVALSNTAYLNDQVLWDIPLSDQALQVANLFRSPGRFSWPVFYFLVLFGLVSLMRNIRFPAPVLALLVVLQLSDLQPLIQPKHLSEFTVYRSSLQADFWPAAAQANRHLVIIPERKLSLDYEPLALYAVQNGLTLNLGLFARSDAAAFAAYAFQVWEALQDGKADAATLYILSDPEWVVQARQALADRLLVCQVDGFTVLLSPQNDLARAWAERPSYCIDPVR
jgi:hypothetical protein